MDADADGNGFLARVKMDESRNVSGHKFRVDALLEFTNASHHGVSMQQSVTIEGHASQPLRTDIGHRLHRSAVPRRVHNRTPRHLRPGPAARSRTAYSGDQQYFLPKSRR